MKNGKGDHTARSCRNEKDVQEQDDMIHPPMVLQIAVQPIDGTDTGVPSVEGGTIDGSHHPYR